MVDVLTPTIRHDGCKQSDKSNSSSSLENSCPHVLLVSSIATTNILLLLTDVYRSSIMAGNQKVGAITGKIPVKESVDRIREFYSKESKSPDSVGSPLHKANPNVDFTGYRLSELLGNVSNGYWWRLYIDPKHYAKAIEANPKNPGEVYDKKALKDYSHDSPGYQAAMTAAFRRFLDYDTSSSQIVLNMFNYRRIFEAISLKGTSTKYVERGGTQNVQYPTAPLLAADLVSTTTDIAAVYEREIFGKRLTIQPISDSKAPRVDQKYFTTWVKPYLKNGPQVNSLGCGNWEPVLEDVFAKLQLDIDAAPTRIKQLEAIARAIRRIHMLHIFTDGNKSVNIHLLLPHLLLRYRFGLPIGGKYRHQFNNPEVLDELFQGGYTVEEIAQCLWIVQDFGLLSKTHADTILYDNKGSSDSTHDNISRGDHKRDAQPQSDSPATNHSKDHQQISPGKDTVADHKHDGGDLKADVQPNSPSGPDHSKDPHKPTPSKGAGANHNRKGVQDTPENAHADHKKTASSTPSKPTAPPTSHVTHTPAATSTNQKPRKVKVSSTTSILHNGKQSNISQNGSQTTITHDGTQSGTSHNGSQITITHTTSDASNAPGEMIHTLVTHGDLSHTTITHAGGQTTIMHHNKAQSSLGTAASASHPQHTVPVTH